MKKIEFKNFSLFSWLRYFYPVTIVIIVIILIFIGWFLYQKVYITLAYAQALTELKKRVPEEDLNKNTFNQLLDNVKNKIKNNDDNISNLKNPFMPLSQATTTVPRN